MGGIYGYSGFDESGLLDRMARVEAHRGLDGGGTFRSARLWMGARWAATRTGADNHQPVYNEDYTAAVCFDGAIFNAPELRQELRRCGHVFRSDCDAEVVVHAYEEWGEDSFARFAGMFAFGLHDTRTGETVLARDSCGLKPLYYYDDGRGCFLFASEIRALLESWRVPRRCNQKAIEPYLVYGELPGEETFFEGIHALPAAHVLIRNARGEVSIKRYFSLAAVAGGEPLDGEEAVGAVGTQLRASVRQAMDVEGPVGVALGSGLNAALLAALLYEYSDQVRSFSVDCTGSSEEALEASEAARLLGISHRTVPCGPEDLGCLPDVIRRLGCPTDDPRVVLESRLAGYVSGDVKVLFSGYGANELFAGAAEHRRMCAAEGLHRRVPDLLRKGMVLPMMRVLPLAVLARLPGVGALFRGSEDKARIIDFVREFESRAVAANLRALQRVWDEGECRRLLVGRNAGGARSPAGALAGGEAELLNRMLEVQFSARRAHDCWVGMDAVAMSGGVEMRAPFLDPVLAGLAMRVRPGMRIRRGEGKWILRRVAANLVPGGVLARQEKSMTSSAVGLLAGPQFDRLVDQTLGEERVRFRGYFNPTAVRSLVKHARGRDPLVLRQLFSLITLELWHQEFIDR